MLDPELANVVRQFHSEIQRQQSLSGNDIRSVTPLLEGGGPETVILKVTWIQHPLEDSGKRQTWAFKVKRVTILHSFNYVCIC